MYEDLCVSDYKNTTMLVYYISVADTIRQLQNTANHLRTIFEVANHEARKI